MRIPLRGPEVALDAGEDRREPDQLPVRVQPEDRVDQPVAAVGHREALPEPPPHLAGADVRAWRARGPRRRLPRLVLRPALLVAAQQAAVVEADGSPPSHSASSIGSVRPHVPQRVANMSAIARREARLAVRRRAASEEGGVEVAQVGRPQDELGKQPRQRARLEAERAALAIDRGAGDPTAAAVEVGHDVARLRVRLETGEQQVRRRVAARAARTRAA